MARSDVNLKAKTNMIAAKRPEVKAVVRAEARKIATTARSMLASHRRSGAMRIGTQSQSPDVVVYLEDSSGQGGAAGFEFGHGDTPGAYVLSAAAGKL